MIAVPQQQSAVLALGGGGARGIAHLGVVEVVEKQPIDIRRIVGVSIGGLAGALCAGGETIDDVQTRVVDYLSSSSFQSKQAALFGAAPDAEEPSTAGLFAWYHEIKRYLGARRKLANLFNKPALLDADLMREIIDALLPDIDIRDLQVPLSIVALDLYSGHKIVLTEGPLKEAVMASAAIPGVFPPVKWNSMLLCDVGMMDAIPVKIARSYGADLTIAVDVGAQVEAISACSTAADILLRLSDIGEPLLREYTKGLADMLIRPDVSHQPWYDFSSPASLIDLGRDAAEASFKSCVPANRPHKQFDQRTGIRTTPQSASP